MRGAAFPRPPPSHAMAMPMGTVGLEGLGGIDKHRRSRLIPPVGVARKDFFGGKKGSSKTCRRLILCGDNL